MLYSRVGSWPYPQTLDSAGKTCQGQTFKLIWLNHELRKKLIVVSTSWAFYAMTRKNLYIMILIKPFSWASKLKCLLMASLFQPCLMFVCEACEWSTYHMLYSRVGSQPYPQTLDSAGKTCQGQTIKLIWLNHDLHKKIVISTSWAFYAVTRKNLYIMILIKPFSWASKLKCLLLASLFSLV